MSEDTSVAGDSTLDSAPPDTALDSADSDTGCEPFTWWPDADGDGYGATTGEDIACVAPAGFVSATGDCDDTHLAVNPGAAEVCDDAVDDDCDGVADACDLGGELPLDGADVVIVGDHDTPVLGALGTVGDIDGDGLDDIAVSAYPGEEKVAIFLAPLSGTVPVTDAFATLEGTANRALDTSTVARVGDLTGIGVDSLAVGSRGEPGRVFVWEAPLGGGAFDTSTALAAVVCDPTDPGILLPYDVIGPGDVDGDGAADLVVSSIDQSTYQDAQEYTWIFRGPMVDDRWTPDADTDITETTIEGAGAFGALAPLGDQDGDGVAEFGILSEPNHTVYVHNGLLTGITSRVFDAVGAVTVIDAAQTIAGADLDGDGYDDLVVGATYANDSAGMLQAFQGPLVGFIGGAPWSLWEGLPEQGLGYSVASLGDVDGDGRGDLLTNGHNRDGEGDAWLLTRLDAGTWSTADATAIFVSTPGVGLGGVAAGDHDGDGLADILLGDDPGDDSAKAALYFGR